MKDSNDNAFIWGVVVTLGLGATLSFALHLETLRAEYRGYREAVEYLRR